MVHLYGIRVVLLVLTLVVDSRNIIELVAIRGYDRKHVTKEDKGLNKLKGRGKGR